MSLGERAREADHPGVELHDDRSRRQPGRFRLGGAARVIIDHPDALLSATGHLVDLSERGCQLRCRTRVDPYLAARVRIEVAGEPFWMPVIIRWVHRDGDEWTVDCAFDRPTSEKVLAIRELLGSHHRVCA
jgi:PilZ domain